MTNATVTAHCHKRHETFDGDLWDDVNYFVLECGGCGQRYFMKEALFSEDAYPETNPVTGEEELSGFRTEYYPAPPATLGAPTWLSQLERHEPALYGLLCEFYGALKHEFRVLAAIGARTIFDHALERLGVDTNLRFDEKLKVVQELGFIGRNDSERVAMLVDAGGAAAHRGWAPSPPELETLRLILEVFVHNNFIVAKQAEQHRTKPPPRAKRRRDG